jgi:beta-N-acetylhexosaminidase
MRWWTVAASRASPRRATPEPHELPHLITPPRPADPRARRRLIALAVAAAAAFALGVLAGSGSDSQAPDTSGVSARAGREASSLSLRQQVGQVLVSSFDGTFAPAYLRRRLRAGETAGVIAFGRNATTPADWRSLTGAVQRAASGSALVAVDQEGGAVRTLPFAPPTAGEPSQGGPGEVRRSALLGGRRLRSLGVNLNLAPVADVAAGPGSIMAARAFAGGPHEVAARTRAAVRGLSAARVGATAKHFPGLGAAGVNTDDGPATVALPSATLLARDVPPFRAAVDAGVPAVMLSHALYPALDPRRIASQSPVVIGLLRRRLGFRGVIVTDSLEAGAVLRHSGVAAAAERSLAAGCDLILMTGSASWNAVFPRLLARARRSPAFRERVRRSAGRVLALKRALGLSSPRPR